MTNKTNHQAKTVADWAYIGIDKHFHKVLRHECGVLLDQDPEELHQIRVGMRRLRSTLTGFAPALTMPKYADQKRVGNLGRILGELRDLDVLKEALINQYQPILPTQEQESLNKVLQVLEIQREKAFKKVEKLLKSSKFLDFKADFTRWLENPTYQPIGKLDIATVLPDLLLPQASRFLLHEGWLIGVNLEEDQIVKEFSSQEIDELLEKEGLLLHDLRKEAKRSRYNMELFTHFYGDQYREYLDDIKNIQSILGEMQDCCVLSDFLSQIFPNCLAKEMPTLLETFQNIRHQKWQEWQPLQKKFLDADTRKSLHETILKPIFEKNGVELGTNPES
jgi:CHAD domain-containing protein